MPGGALVDAARSERVVAAVALAYALWPILPVVFAAACLHAAASCVLGPAIAAISLGLVGHRAIGERLGRNARFASIGSGLSAAVMGACGYYLSAGSVFFVTAALLIPTLFALRQISTAEIDPERAHGSVPRRRTEKSPVDLRSLLHKRPLLIFGGVILLFHLANAAMLPFLGSMLTKRSSEWATVMIAACIVGPQLVVAAFSPWVGRQAERWAPAVVAHRLRRAARPGSLVRRCGGSIPARRGPAARWTDGGRFRRARAADSRRPDARHGTLQPDPGFRRNHDGHRRFAESL
jgi:hypothetical protein